VVFEKAWRMDLCLVEIAAEYVGCVNYKNMKDSFLNENILLEFTVP
jgi:hypothetical protein